MGGNKLVNQAKSRKRFDWMIMRMHSGVYSQVGKRKSGRKLNSREIETKPRDGEGAILEDRGGN